MTRKGSTLQLRRPMARGRKLGLVIGSMIVAVALLTALLLRLAPQPDARTRPSVKIVLPTLPNILRQIAAEDALQLNATRPFTDRPDEAAASFQARSTGEADIARAVGCLAQAIYYEAGGEGVDGERAVAQVVLNRVRHPGYPSSVCGTVYQGSERTTGCQFTFTCDGSLRRIPGGPFWTRAQRLAREAIVGGKVFGPVGHATHYHADYVLPYWADSLDKQIQIGRHIFYRLTGGLGSARAFSQRYSSFEPVPPSPTAAAVAAGAIEGAVESETSASKDLERLLADERAPSPLPPPAPLAIDEKVGSLITPFAPSALKETAEEAGCDAPQASRRIKATTADDLRSGKNPRRC